MYDSTNPNDIPVGAAVVAGYVDGWAAAAWRVGWSRFPNAAKVRIAAFAATNDGNCLDVEAGDAAPWQAPGWVKRRRAAGVDPSVYCSLSVWPQVRAAFAAQGVTEPHYWIAAYPGNGANLYPGSVAHQYASPGTGSGGHFDLSIVPDFWPGVDAPRATVAPAYTGSWRIAWVRPGDTLSKVAARLGFSLLQIERWNPQLNRGRNFNLIFPGDRVRYFR